MVADSQVNWRADSDPVTDFEAAGWPCLVTRLWLALWICQPAITMLAA